MGEGRGKLSPELWVARRSFLPSQDASAFSKHVADCDGRRQEMLDTHCGAEVVADCDGRREIVVADCYGRRQEMLDMLCWVDLVQAHQT